MTVTVLKNARVLNTKTCAFDPYTTVVVENGKISALEDAVLNIEGAEVIDCGGLTLMPGLIDCHVHINMSESSFLGNAILPNSLAAVRAAKIMNGMLMRGFTTVRDVGGADYGFVTAVEEGTIIGPDLVICGKMLCQSAGHQDLRYRWDYRSPEYLRHQIGSISRVCDGVDEVRRAVREEIRAGAKFIKIIANGGVASDHVPMEFHAFSDDEIKAIVEETNNVHSYVAAHAYTDEAISRLVRLGVKTIEHCVFVSPETARLMADMGAVAVPTISTFEVFRTRGAEFGAPEVQIRKAEKATEKAYDALRILKEANVSMVLGTDLTDMALHHHQSDEFRLRASVLDSVDILQSATVGGATLLGKEAEIGYIATGLKADMILVKGNPADDVALLSDPDNIRMIMKSGKVVKRENIPFSA